MKPSVLLGRGTEFSEISQQDLEHHLAFVPAHGKSRLAFMSQDHHRVRDFVVVQLARIGAPLTPEFIAEGLRIQVDRVTAILAELEANLFFLVRNDSGAVSWAFPITSDATVHHLTFSTGEQIFAA